MRIFQSCKELINEAYRDVYEQGIIVKPKTYQDKVIEGNDDFVTKEIMGYQYCLTGIGDEDYLYRKPEDKEWVAKELAERVWIDKLKPWICVNPGLAWELRKDTWEQFLTSSGCFHYSYNERIRHKVRTRIEGVRNEVFMDNLTYVINLLKRDPDTRKAILPIFSIEDVQYNDGSRRIPCSMYYNFQVRIKRGEPMLHISYHQRSSDVVTHFGNDVALAYKLMEYVASKTGYNPGYLYHTIDSLHAYQKDWDVLKDKALG